jgi:exoribonuclease R
MAKKNESKKDETAGEQLDLIDVKPENAKEILKVARAYKKAQKIRMDALKDEIARKEELLEIVRKAKLQPSSDGSLKFSLEEVKITVTPRDELIEIKFKEKDEAAEE